MQRRSPPKHRHDGTSPLPLGMNWSPPPRKWNGRDTVWPHDHRTGWSYCVTIPSWVFLPKSRNSDPIVFYRVQVGVQSPEGIATLHGVLRRFNDFLKFLANLKKEFPRKNIPLAPPKGLMRLKGGALLEERRCALEEWITELLSDIEISRCASVASFIELEAAARSSFQYSSQQNSETDSVSSGRSYSVQSPLHLSLSLIVGSSSVASDYGSDTAYEPSELGTPSVGQDDNSEVGTDDLTLDEDLTNPIEKLVKYGISNIDEGLFMDQRKDVLLQNLNATKEQLESFSKQYEELEAKSKADIKVLVKEVKSLRNSQFELKKELSESLKEKCEAEKLIQHEREKKEKAETATRKLLLKCRLLFNQLQECNGNLPTEDEDKSIMKSSSLTNPLNQLATSDDQIGFLVAEVENLEKDHESAASNVDKINDIKGGVICDDELRKILADLFIDNVRLRKKMNRGTRHALKLDMSASDDSPSMETVISL